MRLAAFVLVFFLLVVLSASCFAQGSSGCAASLAFSAFDEHWRPLDLRPNQLRLKVGHSDLKIDSLKRVSLTPRIVFVIDGSGSMALTTQTRWHFALQTAMDMVSAAPLGTQFGIVMIGGPGDRQVGFTSDKKSTLELIKSFESAGTKGRTALYDAIASAITMLQPPVRGDAIFLLTDGGDNNSKTGWSPLIRQLDAAHLTVLGVLFDEGQYRTPEDTWGANNVREFVERTGGELFEVSDDTLRIHDAAKVLEALPSMLNVWNAVLYHPYVMEVPAGEKAGSVNISFIHSQNGPKSAHLAYGRKLPACSQTQQVATGK